MADLPYRHLDKLAVRRELRRLYDGSPAAFESVIGELSRARERWQEHMPAVERSPGRPVAVGERTLAMLLADYRNRPADCSRERFCCRLAERGCNFGDVYARHVWRNAKTIQRYLDKAEQRARIDPGFAAEVADAMEMLRVLGAGSLKW